MDYIVVELCDGCHVRAVKEFTKNKMTLTMCEHHATQHRVVLEEQGWTEKALESVDLPVPALV